MYTVEIAPAAERALRKLPAGVRNRIFKGLLLLEKAPRVHGVKKLSAEENLYRVRIGDYRVVYQIQDDALVVLVVRVAHRRDVYRRK